MPKYLKNVYFAAGLALLLPGVVANANDINDPFRSANRNPLVQVHGLPVAQSAQLTADGRFNAALNLEASNNFVVDEKGDESIFLDGETYRADLNWRYGIKRFEIGLTVPVISHQGGGSDSFIEEWHDLFGFPEGDRVDYPKDQLRYVYQQGDELLLDMSSNGEGIGDVSLSLAYQLAQTEQQSWALRAGAKFATGEVERLRGSDANDAYLSLHFSQASLGSKENLALHLSGGVLWLGDGEVLSDAQEDEVLFGSSTLAWSYSNSISFKLQIDAHSAFYDSELKQIGDPSAQLIAGASIMAAEKLFVDISISEDIVVDTAPDVVFQLGLRMGEW